MFKKISYSVVTVIVFVSALYCFKHMGKDSLSTNNKVAWYESLPPKTVFQPLYVSSEGDEEDNTIQCPIPMKDRVRNFTGIQCVWSSIEACGRWAEEPKLVNPPLTSRGDCKSYSSPGLAATRLRQLNVKFEQTYDDKALGIVMIKKAMEEGRGCLFGVPGHAMVLVHYDEEADVVKWFDNSDSSLKIQTMTVDRFMRRWAGNDYWVLVVYADKDIIPQKIGMIRGGINVFPITDPFRPQIEFPKDYIPFKAKAKKPLR